MKLLNKIFGKDFDTEPTYICLANASDDQQEINDYIIKKQQERGATWSISGDRENRGLGMYKHNHAIISEGRTVHIGLDINVPAGTILYAPFDCEVIQSEYEEGTGNYGWMCVLKCFINDAVYYFMFGHLAKEILAPVGTKLKAGEIFAKVGEFRENGQYWYHTHLQILTQQGYDQGWAHKATCTVEQLAIIDKLCPSPIIFI